MELIFLVLSVFALYWYLTGSALRKERDLYKQLEVCFTQDEQFTITRKMYATNIKVPDPLPPLLVAASLSGEGVLHAEKRPVKKLKDLSGGGKLGCADCGHIAKILGRSHGPGFTSFSSGYQCQLCSKLKVLNVFPEDKAEEACECGGLLTRNNTLVCPECKSENVNYRMSYIT